MAAPGSLAPQRWLPALDARLLASKQWCFWISGGMACYYAFLPVVYVELLGLSPADVGILSCLSPLVSALATPLWAAAADAWGCHRAVLLATLAASAGLHCLLPLCPRTMACLVPLVLVSEAVGAPCVPLADAAIALTLKRARKPFSDYGKQRLWGAVSWGFVFSPALGAILTYASSAVRSVAPYVAHVACYMLAAASAARLAYPGDTGADANEEAVGGDAPAQRQSFGKVLCAVVAVVRLTPGAPLRMLMFFLFGAVMGAFNGMLFLWLRVLGGTLLLDGLALAMTCVSETAIFYFAGAIQGRLGIGGCVHLVAACYWLRPLLYAALPALGGAWAVLPIQLLHGITFGLLWSVGNEYTRALAPPGLESSLQSFFQGTISLGACVGTVLSGAVVQRHGFRPLFLGWAVVIAVAHALLAASESLAERKSTTATLPGVPPGARCRAAEAAKTHDASYELLVEAGDAPAAAAECEAAPLRDHLRDDGDAGRLLGTEDL